MELPKRKHPRLKDYDYSQNGYYFITINTEKNEPLLAEISVGRGLAPAESTTNNAVILTPIGIIAEEQLLKLPVRYANVKIDKYVIMPTHMHAVIILDGETAGASPRATLTDIVCAYKSLSTRICNQHGHVQGRRIWQTSFYEKIIRDEKGYLEVWQYIDENPLK